MEMGEGESVSEWEKNTRARNQVSEGCRLVRDLETKLNVIASEDMHDVLLSSSAEIVAAFSKALDMLNYNWKRQGLEDEDERLTRRIKCSWNSSSVCPSPTLTPRSGGRSSLSGSGSGSPPTPTLSDYMSPHATPTLTPKLKEESPENEPFSTKERRELSRKRKSLPRKTVRIPANNSEPGNDTPPDDGHTWRKYGQKDILGAQYPRSYYRCTHKNDRGCQATKQVQRADDDPSSFDITYRGAHTCQIDHRILQIQLPYPLGSSTANSATSNTIVFGTDCDLQSNTSTGHGFGASQLHASSAYTPWFVGNACKVKNEASSSFSKTSAASTMFQPLHNLLHMEETKAPDMVQSPNRTENISVSLFRNQEDNGQGENCTEIIHPQQNAGFSAFPDGGLGWPNFGQMFSSPATSESNYISVPTPAMPFISATTCGQRLQSAESDLTDVVSGHTSAADSPMLDIDPFTMFSTVNIDSYFQFERSEPF